MPIKFDEFDYKLLAPEDSFLFKCFGCGDCCRNVKASVMLETLDLFRLAKLLGQKMSEVIQRYTDILSLAWWLPVFVLKTKQYGDTCIFLKASRCSIHEAKPRACRLYPLGVGPDDEDGSWLSFIVSSKPHHFTEQKHLVSDWVAEYFSDEDRNFVEADYTYTKDLANLINSISNIHKDDIIRLVLLYKYNLFSIEENFMPQYLRNMEQLKRMLIKFKRMG